MYEVHVYTLQCTGAVAGASMTRSRSSAHAHLFIFAPAVIDRYVRGACVRACRPSLFVLSHTEPAGAGRRVRHVAPCLVLELLLSVFLPFFFPSFLPSFLPSCAAPFCSLVSCLTLPYPLHPFLLCPRHTHPPVRPPAGVGVPVPKKYVSPGGSLRPS